MDLLDEAKREGIEAWVRGRRYVGSSISRDEAEAIAIASLFEAQDAAPYAPADELLLRVRTTVQKSMRDERRHASQTPARSPALALQLDTSPESKLDRSIVGAWVRDELSRMTWADRKLVEKWAEASSKTALPERVTRGCSRWSVRRSLKRVLSGLRSRGHDDLGTVELPRPRR
jgi:hypothetical protein